MTGFSRLMSQDEARAFAALTRIRNVFTSVVPRHGGTLDVLVGDCFVALFDSAVEAVRAAIAIQTELAGAAGDPPAIPSASASACTWATWCARAPRSTATASTSRHACRPSRGPAASRCRRTSTAPVRNRISLPVRDLGPKSLKNIRDKVRVYEIDVTATPAVARRRTGRRCARSVPSPRGSRRPGGGRPGRLGYQLASRGPPILDVPPVRRRRRPRPPHRRPRGPRPPHGRPPTPAAEPLTVGVTGISAHENVPRWMKDNTRDGLNTLLSKVPPPTRVLA